MSITVKPTITDCSGTIWFTDLMLQEGSALTGYTPHTEKRLIEDSKVWFNGVVRSSETVVLFNLGETSGGLDVHIFPKSDMAAGSVQLAQSVGGQRVRFPNALKAEDNLYLQELGYWEQFTKRSVTPNSNQSELYFEEPDIEQFVERLETLYPEIEYVNQLMTHSWGQKVVRFYDFDGNLIEVGTPV